MAPLNVYTAFDPTSSDICYSKECLEAASNLLQSMNTNIDPCSDFYQYVCGGWIESTVIPEDVEVFGVMEEQEKHHKDKMRSILEGSFNDLLTSALSLDDFSLDTEENRQIDKENFQLIKNYYNSCNDIGMSDDENRLNAFFKEYQDLKLQVFYQSKNRFPFIINKNIMDIISYPKSNDDIIIEVGGLYSIEITYDETDRNRMSIDVYPPLDFEDRNTSPLTDHTNQELLELVSALFSPHNFNEEDTRRIELLSNLGINTLSDREIRTLVDNSMSVQNKLFQLSKDETQQTYNLYTLNDLVENFPFTDWRSILLKNNLKYESDITINIFNEQYFRELNYYMNIIDTSRVLNKESILNYLTLHKILHVASNLDKHVRDIIQDSPFQTRSSICIDKVIDNLGHAVGRIYSMIAFGEEDRLKLEEISATIEISLGNIIENSDWLDASTRAAAINKLSKMKKVIGYSTDSPDIRSPKEIQDYLTGLDITDNFYANEISVQKWILSKYWDTLGRVIEFPEWIGIPGSQQLVAMNLLSKNSIFVSAAYAQKPYFDKKYPDYLNYAGIGQTIAHEYSHSFDSTGADFDENGVIRNWWSKLARMRYSDKTQCFVDQYSEAYLIDENEDEHHIDGYKTLGENIADNLGLSASYDAYLQAKESGTGYNPILPGFQDFSADALFFISAGRSFCSKATPDTLNDMLQDEHSPDSIRANKIFQNNGDFSRAFNCPVNTNMNPSKKCKVW